MYWNTSASLPEVMIQNSGGFVIAESEWCGVDAGNVVARIKS
jgi:hypothetical protein